MKDNETTRRIEENERLAQMVREANEKNVSAGAMIECLGDKLEEDIVTLRQMHMGIEFAFRHGFSSPKLKGFVDDYFTAFDRCFISSGAVRIVEKMLQKALVEKVVEEVEDEAKARQEQAV